MRLRSNDNVLVLKGRDRGKVGRIQQIFPKHDKVLVEGVNLRLKHTKPNQTYPNGGRIEAEKPIHVSNVAVLSPADEKPAGTDAAGLPANLVASG